VGSGGVCPQAASRIANTPIRNKARFIFPPFQ
jgi:hypothetical protein